MLATLITVHGLIRWVLAALALIALVRYATGWLGKRSFTAADRQLGAIYAGAITVQFVLGLVNLILLGGERRLSARRPYRACVLRPACDRIDAHDAYV